MSSSQVTADSGAADSGAADDTSTVPGRRTALARSAATWTVIGLLSGLYYRELTRSQGFTERTQLAVAHTHTLTLGTLTLLVVLALTLHLRLHLVRSYRWMLPVWNVGLAITTAGMLTRGTLQVLGSDLVAADASASKALAGISGLGHITLTVAFVLLFVAVLRRVRVVDEERA